MINWPSVCLPKKWGGLGIPDLELRNTALLLRWWWRLYWDPDSLWAIVATKIRSKSTYANGPRLWVINGSFFWKQLIRIHFIFQWSTTWCVGHGRSISFWYDSWAGVSLAKLGKGVRLQQVTASLSDAHSIASQFPDHTESLRQLQLMEMEDQIVWKWTASGLYSASSAYKIMMAGGKVQWPFMAVWKSRVPPSVKFFATMLFRDKLLTHQVMERRRMHCDLHCVICNNCPVESSLHLFFLCLFAAHVWFLVSREVGYKVMQQDLTVQDIWHKSARMRGNRKKKEWAALFLATL